MKREAQLDRAVVSEEIGKGAIKGYLICTLELYRVRSCNTSTYVSVATSRKVLWQELVKPVIMTMVIRMADIPQPIAHDRISCQDRATHDSTLPIAIVWVGFGDLAVCPCIRLRLARK